MSENNFEVKEIINDAHDLIITLKNANKTLLACAGALERNELEEGALDVVMECFDVGLNKLAKICDAIWLKCDD